MNLRPIQFSINDKGRLDFPALHDSELIEMKLEGRDQIGAAKSLALVLNFKGKNFRVVLESISILSCDDFSYQNVIFNVWFYNGLDPMSELVQHKDKIHKNSDSQLRQLADEVVRGQKAVFILEPSVGCGIFCVCKKMELFEIGT